MLERRIDMVGMGQELTEKMRWSRSKTLGAWLWACDNIENSRFEQNTFESWRRTLLHVKSGFETEERNSVQTQTWKSTRWDVIPVSHVHLGNLHDEVLERLLDTKTMVFMRLLSKIDSFQPNSRTGKWQLHHRNEYEGNRLEAVNLNTRVGRGRRLWLVGSILAGMMMRWSNTCLGRLCKCSRLVWGCIKMHNARTTVAA
jgi:hypothetical protein